MGKRGHSKKTVESGKKVKKITSCYPGCKINKENNTPDSDVGRVQKENYPKNFHSKDHCCFILFPLVFKQAHYYLPSPRHYPSRF